MLDAVQLRTALLLLLVTWMPVRSVVADQYCEDFELGGLGDFWEQSHGDTGGQWEPRSYLELKEEIPDFPEPYSGDTVLYLTANGGYVSARLQMREAVNFPNGSTISFRYWLRSQWSGSGNLEVRRIIGTQEEQKGFLVLTEESGPDNCHWKEVNASIPSYSEKFKLLIFGACGDNSLDNIAVDDVRVCGPEGIQHECVSLTTTSTPSSNSATTPVPSSSTTAPVPSSSSSTTTPVPSSTTTPVPSSTTNTPVSSSSPAPPPPCEYCEDFEDGYLSPVWGASVLDRGGRWRVGRYSELAGWLPRPVGASAGDTLLYLTSAGSPVTARLEMNQPARFGPSATIWFRYWLRSARSGAATLQVKRIVRSYEDQRGFLRLSDTDSRGGWRLANASVPTDTGQLLKIIFYAVMNGEPGDGMALDGIRICGADLFSQCSSNFSWV